MVKLQPFDTARHLDNPEVIAHYLAEAMQSGDGKLILRAMQNVARANNMSKIARETGMSRTSLYWRENTSPEFTTVLKLLASLGVRLRAEPIAKDAPRKLGKRLIQAAREGVAFARGEPEAVPWHPISAIHPAHALPMRLSPGRSAKKTMHRSAKGVMRTAKKAKHPAARKKK